MSNDQYLKKYIQLYEDFLHPNPNINSKAIFLLKKEFRLQFMTQLLTNLEEEDLLIEENQY